MQREKEDNKKDLTLCGLGKRNGRGKGEKGLWPGEMSCLTAKLPLPAALGALLGEDINND